MEGLMHKATARAAPDAANALTYVMSDESVDRMGDVIAQDGWQLANFKRNPIALFGHDSEQPIGNWTNVRVENGMLMGDLSLLPVGRSSRVDELRAFIEAGMLRAVSVGFRPVEVEQLQDGPGYGLRYTKSELLECSLVSVPANANALQVAKQFNLSDAAKAMVFGKSAYETANRAAPTSGKSAASHSSRKTTIMTKTLAQRIEDAQEDLNRDRDLLTAEVEKDGDPDIIEELSGRIEKTNKGLDALRRAETVLAAKSDSARPGLVPNGGAEITTAPGGNDAKPVRRLFAEPQQKIAPRDYVWRSIAVAVAAHQQNRHAHDVLQRAYGEDEATKLVFDIVTRGATAPAMTNVSGWAAQLVQTATTDFMDALMPNAIYPKLAELGLRLGFGRYGQIIIPTRNATPAIAGSFVGEGAPIPVRQGSFGSVTLTPKNMKVITSWTKEADAHTMPALQGLLQTVIQEDTTVSIDTVLADAGAATAVRPAGLRNGITGATPATGGGLIAAVTDLKNLLGALISASNGNLRVPVWLINPMQVLSLSMMQDSSGGFPFKAEIGEGKLLGKPFIESANVPTGLLMVVDAADFVSVTGDEPQFTVSDQATLHMEDTAPQPIGTVGTPNVVAAPARNLFQTDSLAIKMVLPMNWTLRRAGVVAFVNGVTW